MIIDQLPNIQLPVLGTDEMPVERGQYTYKAAFEDISTTIKNSLDIIRPNLLDNWYFLSGDYYGLPINSRNKSTYSIPAARTYTLDRWFAYDSGGSGTFEKYSNGVKLNKSGSTIEFGQFLEPVLIGETVTISVLVENTRRLISGTGVVANNAVLIDDPYLTASFTRESSAVSTMTVLHLNFKSNSSLVLAAKLEIGDSQTLAHQENGTWVLNELPNYEEQLTRCMVSRADQADPYANNVISFNAPNPNLLDNWYFVGGGSQQGGGQFPINQRGQTSYTSGYGIDRWTYGSSVTINSGYLTISNTTASNKFFSQKFSDIFAGKRVCGSALLSSGDLLSGSGVFPSNGGSNVNLFSNSDFTCRVENQSGQSPMITLVVPANKTVNIVAIKLEIGTTQTLAHQENGVWVLNEIPNYVEQRLKCNRFYLKLSNAIRYPSTRFISGEIDFLVPVPVQFAKLPTIDGTATVYSDSTAQTGFTFSVAGSNDNAIAIRAAKSSHGLSDSGVYLAVSNVALVADL